MFEPMELTNDAVIKVIGVGGGGGNVAGLSRNGADAGKGQIYSEGSGDDRAAFLAVDAE